MVLKPEPLFAAVEDLMPADGERPRVILMCPQGEPYTQRKAEELAAQEHLVFVCGHYEGFCAGAQAWAARRAGRFTSSP